MKKNWKDHLKHFFLFCLLVWGDGNCLPHFTRLPSLLVHHLGISQVILSAFLLKEPFLWEILHCWNTFAFFQDLSLFRSYFSTSLPWLSTSTCNVKMKMRHREIILWVINCARITNLFCKFDAPLLPSIVPWWTSKTNSTAEKEKGQISFDIEPK